MWQIEAPPQRMTPPARLSQLEFYLWGSKWCKVKTFRRRQIFGQPPSASLESQKYKSYSNAQFWKSWLDFWSIHSQIIQLYLAEEKRASFGNPQRLQHLRLRGIPPWSSPNEETEHMHKLRVGVLNAKTPLPGAEFKIWPLKSAPEVTYFGNKFLICLGFASPN